MLARIAAAVLALVLLAPPAAAQVLRGTVIDTTSGKPLDGVRVIAFSVAGARMGDAVTKTDGQFGFRVPTVGAYRLQATRLGYATTITELIPMDSATEVDVLLPMVRRPVALDTVTVVARPLPATLKLLPYLVDAGFYRRQRWGFGYFLTRADIDKRDPLAVSDLFYGISGVRVLCGRSGFCDLLMPAAASMFYRGTCWPSVVLDGVVIRAGGVNGGPELDELLDPFNIEAIEVYRSAAGVPVQYSGYLSPCGAILAWSRR